MWAEKLACLLGKVIWRALDHHYLGRAWRDLLAKVFCVGFAQNRGLQLAMEAEMELENGTFFSASCFSSCPSWL